MLQTQPVAKSKYKERHAASLAAASRLKASCPSYVDAHINKKLASDDPRTAWLAREVVCAKQTSHAERYTRALNELFQRTEVFSDGMVGSIWPIGVVFDSWEMHAVKGHKENLFLLNDDGCYGFVIAQEDFDDLDRYQTDLRLGGPYIYADNPYYEEPPDGTPIQTPFLAKPTYTLEESLNHMAHLTPVEYESVRLAASAKLKFRLGALDHEYEFRRKFFLGQGAA